MHPTIANNNNITTISSDVPISDDELVNKYLNFELPPESSNVKIENRNISKFNLLKKWEGELFDSIDRSFYTTVHSLLYTDLPLWQSSLLTDKITEIMKRAITRAARATASDSVKVMKLLLFFYAGNGMKFEFEGFNSPLFHAVCAQNIEMVDFLLKNYTLKHQKSKSNNVFPLNRAASLGNLEICKLLIEKNFDVNNHSFGKNTPIFCATCNGHLEVIKLLLKHNADPNARAEGQDTPLYQATLRGYAHIVKELISSEADINCNTTGENTAFYVAVYNNQHFIAKLLSAKGLRYQGKRI